MSFTLNETLSLGLFGPLPADRHGINTVVLLSPLGKQHGDANLLGEGVISTLFFLCCLSVLHVGNVSLSLPA